jgi:integrase/recombinase XerD
MNIAIDSLPVVALQMVHHRGSKWLLIASDDTRCFYNVLSRLPGRKYSATYRNWLLPFNRQSYTGLTLALRDKAIINTSALKMAVAVRNPPASATSYEAIQSHPVRVMPEYNRPASTATRSYKITRSLTLPAISAANKDVLPAMLRHLQLKSYSESTIRTYMNEMSQFIKAIKGHDAADFDTDRLKNYLQYCYSTLQLSENTIHSRINSLKFYYEQVLKREKLFWEIPRPKKPMILPKLLNETEIAKLFNALTNKKHKAMLFLAYSAGLRVSEVAFLKIADIDSGRMQIFVERAKGKKDRYVNLSPVVLDILRKYIKEYAPRPRVYLFESEQTLTAYPTRTLQQIFSNAKQKAGIRKEVGIHSLRHSFATHLLEKGTDIKYIKEILGHFNIKTTERYLHVSRKQLVNIVSPFDDLWHKDGIDW